MSPPARPLPSPEADRAFRVRNTDDPTDRPGGIAPCRIGRDLLTRTRRTGPRRPAERRIARLAHALQDPVRGKRAPDTPPAGREALNEPSAGQQDIAKPATRADDHPTAGTAQKTAAGTAQEPTAGTTQEPTAGTARHATAGTAQECTARPAPSSGVRAGERAVPRTGKSRPPPRPLLRNRKASSQEADS
ncbi:hypothetical protein ACTI_80680 [Actinoplanes sp. OR16]|nr:hypothetical protein ACTI_80680 [Actinoplanes sp. OR16]